MGTVGSTEHANADFLAQLQCDPCNLIVMMGKQFDRIYHVEVAKTAKRGMNSFVILRNMLMCLWLLGRCQK